MGKKLESWENVLHVSAPRMPNFENVMLVENLKVNLISISQLCDDNHDIGNVWFDKKIVQCERFTWKGDLEWSKVQGQLLQYIGKQCSDK